MATTTIQGLPYPASTDAANVPSWQQQLAQAVEVKLNMIFSSTATRDAALPSPTAGMEVFITGTGEKQIRTSAGTWQVEGGRGQPFAMAAGQATLTMTSGSNAVTLAGIALPSGRFSQPPLMTGSLAGAPSDIFNGATIIFLAVTATTFSIELTTANGTWATTQTVPVTWVAVQMTSSSAAG